MKTLKQPMRRWASPLHLVLWTMLDLSCSRNPKAKGYLGSEVPAPVEDRTPGEPLNIIVDPSRLGSSGLLLRLCYGSTSQYDPEVIHVRVAQVRGGSNVCEIRSIKDAWLWKEWDVGTLPAGFRFVQCDKLSPGEYEIYVDGIVGTGEIRVKIDSGGGVERVPWDEHDRLFRQTCDRVRHERPNPIPRQDEGLDEGLLVKKVRSLHTGQ